MVAALPRSQVLSLYRDLFRAAKGFSNYNFRDYAMRYVRDDFRAGAKLEGDAALQAFQQGRQQLVALRRQSAVSQLFPQSKHAME